MAELTGRALIASRCAKFFKNGDFVNRCSSDVCELSS